MKFLKRLYRKKRYGEPVVVVSGLPRSGTSMMMGMLEAGGVEILTDGIRTADEDNPKGYFEYEPVKELTKDGSKLWLEDAPGKAVKIISELLKELPSDLNFKLIFMKRNLEEVIVSQNKMLVRRGESADGDEDERMMLLFARHLEKVKKWIERQSHFEAIFLDYEKVVEDPDSRAEQIRAFLQRELDLTRMARVVDRQLYRNRG
jgi:hypothetical protein